jgi:tripartite-type tricarboxylate transporter receptor subunit TctC
VPIVLVADVPNVLVVNNDIPAKDLAEFERYAKANPGKLNFGSTGIGSSMHLAGELFMRETGAQMLHVPYNAPGTATTNLIAGEIQLMFQLIPGIAGQVKSGKVRAIAVMAPQRSPGLPDVPTTAELGQPKLLSSTWFALLAPKGTPSAVLQKVNAVTNEALADPAVKKRLADIGVSTLGGTPEQLAKTIADETEKWGRVVREAKIQAQ